MAKSDNRLPVRLLDPRLPVTLLPFRPLRGISSHFRVTMNVSSLFNVLGQQHGPCTDMTARL